MNPVINPVSIDDLGRAVPACGYNLKDRIDDNGDVSELLNNPPAGGLLTGMKSFASEPPAYRH